MDLNNFQKKRFKLIPGADYEGGPISRDGTFFKMLGRKMTERNKQIADSIPNHDADVSGAHIDSITDFATPMGAIGSIVRKYGIEEAAKKLNPKQSMTGEQFSKFLSNKGVSPKQIEMANLSSKEPMSGADWFKKLRSERQYGLNTHGTNDEFGDVLLPESDRGSYGTNLTKFNVVDAIPGNPDSILPPSHYRPMAYAAHTRTTDEIIDKKPIKMIQEAQSDYAQAERQGKGMFESTLKKDLDKPIQIAAKQRHDFTQSMDAKYGDNYSVADMSNKDKKTWHKLGKKLDDAIDFRGYKAKVELGQQNIKEAQVEVDEVLKLNDEHKDQMAKKYGEPYSLDRTPEEKLKSDFLEEREYEVSQNLKRGNHTAEAYPLLRNLPIKPEALRRDSIMAEMNSAMDEDYARVGVPVIRHDNMDNPLAGTEEVTASYIQNIPQDFRAIKKHMAKQGITARLGMPSSKGGDIPASQWNTGSVTEDSLRGAYYDELEGVKNQIEHYRGEGRDSMADNFEEMRYMMEEGFFDDEPVAMYKNFKNRINNSEMMEKQEAFQELFEAIERSGGEPSKNLIYTMEFDKPFGREADHWKDIDVDWKVW